MLALERFERCVLKLQSSAPVAAGRCSAEAGPAFVPALLPAQAATVAWRCPQAAAALPLLLLLPGSTAAAATASGEPSFIPLQDIFPEPRLGKLKIAHMQSSLTSIFSFRRISS